MLTIVMFASRAVYPFSQKHKLFHSPSSSFSSSYGTLFATTNFPNEPSKVFKMSFLYIFLRLFAAPELHFRDSSLFLLTMPTSLKQSNNYYVFL